MEKRVLLLLLAIVCDWLLIGIFSYDYRKSKDKYELFIILGLIFVFFACVYFLLQRLGVVIVI